MGDQDHSVVVRMWRGIVRSADLAEYVAYVRRTGIDEYRSIPGNLGADILTRPLDNERSEIVAVSRWESIAAIRAFAGADVARAVYYPEDDRFLVDRDEFVTHYDVAG